MPYATPSPSTSPGSTSTILVSPPRSGPSTPRRGSLVSASPTTLPMDPPTSSASSSTTVRSIRQKGRNHVRSYSHDALPTAPEADDHKGYIFVHPATPSTESGTSKSNGTGAAGLSELAWGGRTTSVPDSMQTIRARRSKMPSFTEISKGDSDGSPSGDKDASRRACDSPAPALTLPKRPLHQKARSEMALRLELDDTELAAAERHFKTPMLRKKSGELVRSSLKTTETRRNKAKSAPATPLGPKYVHFDSHLEHVKHFLSQQRPAAVSRDGSPVETETEGEEEFPFPPMVEDKGKITLHMPNFPLSPDLDGKVKDVYLRSIDLSTDGKTLKGVVQVKNLSFAKWVAIRFTFDNWQTVSEVSGEWQESLPGGQSDRFSFAIKMQDLWARIENKVMFLAVRFTTNGQEIWDNNGGPNYHIEFRKLRTHAAPVSSVGEGNGKKGYQWSVTTTGQAQNRMAELRAELNRLVGDDLGIDVPQPTFKSASRDAATGGGSGVFSSRYDFGMSLKQATRNRDASSPRHSGSPRNGLAFPSTFIGGMPATSAEDALSPRTLPRELPSFVAPYVPASQRPPSPPQEADEGEKPLNQTHKPGTRFFSFPPTRPGMTVYAPIGHVDRLAPPELRDLSSESPDITPSASPLASPLSRSPPQQCLSPATMASMTMLQTGLPPPSPSESGPSSPESLQHASPTAPRPYILDNGAAGLGNLTGPASSTGVESSTYGDFVQNFCWGGALGLTTEAGDPLRAFSYGANTAAIATPRSASPMTPDAAANFGRSSSPFHQLGQQHAIS